MSLLRTDVSYANQKARIAPGAIKSSLARKFIFWSSAGQSSCLLNIHNGAPNNCWALGRVKEAGPETVSVWRQETRKIQSIVIFTRNGQEGRKVTTFTW